MTRPVATCTCPACRPDSLRYTSRPLPECSQCGAPVNRERYERNKGVCTRCIPSNADAFRAARDRVVEQQRIDQREARQARERQRRAGGRRG